MVEMDRRITADVDASRPEVIAALADLTTYPHWLSLVAAAEAEPNVGEPVWIVTLRAKLGRLARSKRLRMRRTDLTEDSVRFVRDEVDGRQHAEWILQATVTDGDAGRCQALVHLHYGGALWSTPLEIVLSKFEGSAGERLTAYLRNG